MKSNLKKVAIFLGPSIAPSELPALPEGTTLLPPAAQGDLYRSARAGYNAIGLIDGYFDSIPSVWHKEILWALSQGIVVLGAASMGALRAAECEDYGMVGLGKVFDWYSSGLIEDDDEVALLHGPRKIDYRPFTLPMVNVRSTIDGILDRCIEQSERRQFLNAAKDIHYQDRDLAKLSSTPPPEIAPTRWKELICIFESNYKNQKRDDALLLVEHITNIDYIDSLRGRSAMAKFYQNSNWLEFTSRAAFMNGSDANIEELGSLVDSPISDLALLRCIATRVAEPLGFTPTGAELIRHIMAVARSAGINSEEDLARWTSENGITSQDLYAIGQQESAVAWLKNVAEHELVTTINQRGEWLRATLDKID